MKEEKKNIEKVLNVPNLRFPGFEGEWETHKLGEIAYFSKGKGISKSDIHENGKNDCIRYGELYTHYGEVIIETRSKTNVDPVDLIFSEANDVIIPSSGETQIDIATASCVIESGVALGGDLNIIKTPNNGVFLSYYLNSKKKIKIANLAQGGSVVHLYSKQLASLKINFPSLIEQNKIAHFITLIDRRISTQSEIIDNLESLKKGLCQKLFSQHLQLRNENGEKFPKWEKRRFSDVLFEHKFKSTGNEEVHSVSVHKGVINQIEHLGRSFSAKNTDHYSRVLPNDIIYTKSPTGDFPLGIIKQSHISKDVIVSPLYGVFTPETKEMGYILHVYFESKINTSNYLGSIIQKGAKNTINITNNTFLTKRLLLPISKKEQTKIANFLSSIDNKIEVEKEVLDQFKNQKKYFLQNLFI